MNSRWCGSFPPPSLHAGWPTLSSWRLPWNVVRYSGFDSNEASILYHILDRKWQLYTGSWVLIFLFAFIILSWGRLEETLGEDVIDTNFLGAQPRPCTCKLVLHAHVEELTELQLWWMLVPCTLWLFKGSDSVRWILNGNIKNSMQWVAYQESQIVCLVGILSSSCRRLAAQSSLCLILAVLLCSRQLHQCSRFGRLSSAIIYIMFRKILLNHRNSVPGPLQNCYWNLNSIWLCSIARSPPFQLARSFSETSVKMKAS